MYINLESSKTLLTSLFPLSLSASSWDAGFPFLDLEDMGIPLPHPMHHAGMVALANAPVIFGGVDSHGHELSSVLKLDLMAKKWVILPAMRGGSRTEHGVAVVPECWLCGPCTTTSGIY